MAERTALSKNGYSNIERGECVPSIDSLEKIANAFNMKFEELIAWEDNNCHISIINGYVSNYANSNYYGNDKGLELKIQLLEQQIEHKKSLNAQKDEIIASLKNENQLLKEMNTFLKQTSINP